MIFLSEVTDLSHKLATDHADQLISILAYPHPFTAGGIITVWRDDAEPWLDLVATVQIHTPPKLSRHCLRQSELSLLSLPNLFAPPLQVSERVHLPYWLHHKGHVLFGDDLRAVIQPVAPTVALAGHLEGCLDYMRRYGILTLLMQDKHVELTNLLAQEMRYLMGTALLLYGEWDVALETLPEQFQSYFPNEYQLWVELDELKTAVSQQNTYRCVWLFEQFLRQLRIYT